jgi:hypothetical protein
MASLAAACGGASQRPPVAPPTEPALAERLSGTWRWSHASEEQGVSRRETEVWQLSAHGDRLTGSCRREIRFDSVDGTPFECSQRASYLLRTDYQLSGRVAQGRGWLEEVSYRTEPSPCEPGHRRTVRYQLALARGRLQLRWPGGRQLLRRARSSASPAPEPPRSATGRWTWSNRRVSARGEVREEVEAWTLEEAEDSELTGSYERKVVVSNADGSAHPCTGSDRHSYTDRYQVRGWRQGDAIVIAEVAAQPDDPSPCLRQSDRHLDQADGRVYPHAIELTWRGKSRQVLTRTP